MAEFLAGYGEANARRARIFWRLVIAALVLLAAGLGLYFGFRTYPAKRAANRFIEDLRRRDYQSAHRLWGCTPTSPCRDYTLEKFLEDWGPSSPNRDAASMTIAGTRYCGPGVIVTLQSRAAAPVYLWYERKDSTLGFAPWPVCAPQPKAYQ